MAPKTKLLKLLKGSRFADIGGSGARVVADPISLHSDVMAI
jgi:hypothetical protein